MSFFLGFAKGLQFSMDQKLEREKIALDREKFEKSLQAERENILLRGKIARETAAFTYSLEKEAELEAKTKAENEFLAMYIEDPRLRQAALLSPHKDKIISALQSDTTDHNTYLPQLSAYLSSMLKNDSMSDEDAASRIAAASVAAINGASPQEVGAIADVTVMDFDDISTGLRLDRTDSTALDKAIWSTILEKNPDVKVTFSPDGRPIMSSETEASVRQAAILDYGILEQTARRQLEASKNPVTGEPNWAVLGPTLSSTYSGILTERAPLPPSVSSPATGADAGTDLLVGSNGASGEEPVKVSSPPQAPTTRVIPGSGRNPDRVVVEQPTGTNLDWSSIVTQTQ